MTLKNNKKRVITQWKESMIKAKKGKQALSYTTHIFFYVPLSYFIYLFIYLFIFCSINSAMGVHLNKILQINTNKSVIPLWQGNIRSQRVLLFQQTVQYRVWMGLTD